MLLDKPCTPKINTLLQLSVVRIEEGKYYSEFYASEDDCFPYEEGYMEWAEDWFDLESPKPTHGSGTLISDENELKALKSGYIIMNVQSIGGVFDNGFTNIVDYEIEMIGAREFITNLELKRLFDKLEDEDVITLVFGVHCDTDWESGQDECEPDHLGVFDYVSGKVNYLWEEE